MIQRVILERLFTKGHLLLLFFPIVAFLLYKGALIAPDTKQYIAMQADLDPLYPIFLKLLSFSLGQWYLTVAAYIQVLLAFFSIAFFINYLKDEFSLPIFMQWCLAIIIVFPLILGLNLSNRLLTEGLAYPLFFFSLPFLFKTVLHNNIRSFLFFSLLLTLLLLVRGQFIFIYPVLILLVLYKLLSGLFSLKKVSVFILIVVGSFVIKRGINTIYWELHPNKTATAVRTSSQFAAEAFYIAKASDSTLFDNADDKLVFNHVYNELILLDANYESLEKKSPKQVSMHYYNAPLLTHRVLENTPNKTGLAELNVNQSLGRIAYPLIKVNVSRFLKVYLIDFIFHGLGLMGTILLMITLLISLIITFLSKSTKAELLLWIATLAFSNIAVVALVHRVLDRYVVYTNILFVVMLCLFVYSALEGKVGGLKRDIQSGINSEN